MYIYIDSFITCFRPYVCCVPLLLVHTIMNDIITISCDPEFGGLCCLDIGFHHIIPPRPGTMNNMVTAGYSCLVISLQMSHP